MQNICAGNLCFTLSPPSPTAGERPALVPKPLPGLGSGEAVVTASFRVEVNIAASFLEKKGREQEREGRERGRGRRRGGEGQSREQEGQL